MTKTDESLVMSLFAAEHPPSEPMFYIYSKDDADRHEFVAWWKPMACGYTKDLGRAGRYTKAQADEITGRGCTVAVPEKVAVDAAMQIVPMDRLRSFLLESAA